ncbi:hypothetical protein KUV95_11855 [Microbulbifer agarilyticus]|uniref:hypothetical protein n=1 Tax=Microbulbifer agarilyticus TaxID=260552 RepID=UPI001C9704C1|nr:hypothetical protein [Microbulbifer agarilyticus]MBY6212246.1 hypothetical protein [Microbulbifer agarilyticus]
MKSVVLHVGRHKTGTSSLQSFFNENREVLAASGIYYPKIGLRGNAHHLVAEAFSGPARKAVVSPCENTLVQELRKEMLQAPESTILLSSEAFQNVAPALVAKIFSGFEVTVVMYLREQSLYLRSAYAQRIHATNTTLSLAEYYQRTFLRSSDYADYLRRWESIFGERLDVLRYDRSALKNESIIDDFCQRYINDICSGNFISPNNANPSLSETYLYYKLLLNHFIPEGDKIPGLYQRLGELSQEAPVADCYRLSKRRVEQVVDEHRETNAQLAQRYFGGTRLFSKFERPREASAPFPLTVSKVEEITNQLLTVLPRLRGLVGSGAEFSQSSEAKIVLEKIRTQFIEEYIAQDFDLRHLKGGLLGRVLKFSDRFFKKEDA